MTKFPLGLISDIISLFIISFLFSLVIIGFFVTSPLSVVLALSVSLLFTLTVSKYMLEKRRKKNDKLKHDAFFNSVMTQLNYQPRVKNDALFFSAYQKLNRAVKMRKNGFTVEDENTVVFTRFGFDELLKSDIIKIYNLISEKQTAIIYAQSFSPSVIEFSKKFNKKIILKNGDEAFSLLKQSNTFPSIKFTLDTSPKKVKFTYKNVFVKKKAKTFLGFGVIFFIMSYFVPLKLYYVVCGGIMLIVSAICILFGTTDKQTNKT